MASQLDIGAPRPSLSNANSSPSSGEKSELTRRTSNTRTTTSGPAGTVSSVPAAPPVATASRSVANRPPDPRRRSAIFRV